MPIDKEKNKIPLRVEYLGMDLSISDSETDNLQYFNWCANHEFRLQSCSACSLLRYPPTTACPWCSCPDSQWIPVETKGVVHSYTEVHHAIQSGFKQHSPYIVLLVELETQRGMPSSDEALRIIGNLAVSNGDLAPPDMIKRVGIGTRVRMVFKDLAPGLALPMWAVDEAAVQPSSIWRYPQE